MIAESIIRELVEEKIAGSDRFIVSIRVSVNNRIEILLDGLTNISIKDCIDMSRHIESSLDRETEDFELQVSSSGIDEPLVMEQQYVKNTGRNVEILKTDGVKLEGKLLGLLEDTKEIRIENSRTEKNEKGKKQTITEQITIPLQEVKETKLVLSFK
ncbi:MAG: rimP [Bacteroidetes bacterium]|jgi:ribosome maturation factor RimP|nr:rimP [Bacteroidota bacterium]